MEQNKQSKLILLVCLIAAAVLIEALIVWSITTRDNSVESNVVYKTGYVSEDENQDSDFTETESANDENTCNSVIDNEPTPVDVGSLDYSVLSTRKLSDDELAGLTKEELRIARNEIYARHGYIFKSNDLREYFSSKSWYQPMYSDASSLSLNEFEIYNVDLIKRHE